MSRFTISLEPHLARQLDRLVAQAGHANRSAAVREMIRSGLNKADIGVAAVHAPPSCLAHVSLLCARSKSTVSTRLVRLLHERRNLVRSMSRVLVDNDQLMEIVVLAGDAVAVRSCVDKIVLLKGASNAAAVFSPLEEPA